MFRVLTRARDLCGKDRPTLGEAEKKDIRGTVIKGVVLNLSMDTGEDSFSEDWSIACSSLVTTASGSFSTHQARAFVSWSGKYLMLCNAETASSLLGELKITWRLDLPNESYWQPWMEMSSIVTPLSKDPSTAQRRGLCTAYPVLEAGRILAVPGLVQTKD